MTAEFDKAWEAINAEKGSARAKYLPLVARLSLGEFLALHEVVNERAAVLRDHALARAVREGYRPPGTRLGR